MATTTELRPFKDHVERVITALNQQTSGIADPAQWLIDAFAAGEKTRSGVNVNEYTALGWPPLYAAVARIAGHIATMPLTLHEKRPDGSTTPIDDPRNMVVRQVNEWQLGCVFREQLQSHALLHGNGRAYIVRNELGQPIELIPLLPQDTRTVLIKGVKYHWLITPSMWDYTTQFVPGRSYYLKDEDCLHILGLSGNGAWGYSIIHMMREAIGLGLAGQLAASTAFNNLGRPGIILEAPTGKFRDPKKAKEFLDKFDAAQAGLDNAGKTALLREGVTAKILQISNEDSQFLQQRVHQREEAGLMTFLELLTGDKGPYKSITEKMTMYLINCLNRWIVKWEEEHNCKFLTEAEKLADNLCWKFDVSVLLKGDPNSLADYTGKLRQQAVVNGNEVRRMHNLPEVEDEALQIYANPNTTSAGQFEENKEDKEDREKLNNQSETMQRLAKNVLKNRVRHLVNVECKKVQRAAGNRPDFAEFVDSFYADWQRELQGLMDEVGVDPLIANDHCDRSRAVLVECTKLADIDQLADTVAGCIEDWPTIRADELTDKILEEATKDV